MASNESELRSKIENLKLNDKSDINILLLGETGVGKSTFINSIANYLTYTDLKRAEKENLLTLIPSNYEIRDKNGIYHVIQIGSEQDQNEYLETGVSATQDVKTYVFPIWGGKTKLRIIDTPGMGDTRGIKQDNINCENILTYISQLHELHAICFLFKPTNARLTAFFEYCMSQILSRLDKSASKNLIFVFTNTRGTDYGPGETFPLLQKVVRDIKDRPPNVDIPLNRNVFCFDNEAFRYLAAVKQGVEFDNSIKDRNTDSWKKSVEQCWKLINYIVGDTNNSPLKPHFIKSTSAINEARRLIVQLSQPLAEITQLINDNIHALQRHREHLNLDNNTLDELKKKLFMPVINLDVVKLTQPVTVCTQLGCSEVYQVGDQNKWHYKQRCHDPCYLSNVPKEIIGSPELVNCAAIDSTTRKCKRCGCDFSVHMHVYYMTKTKEDHIVNVAVQGNINSKEQLLQNAQKLFDDMSQRRDELEKEHNLIVKCCARFAHFLQNNAITPFSDSYKEYIEYLILREKSLGQLSNAATIRHLKKLLDEYEESKRSFDEALQLQKRLGDSDVFVTPQKIQESIQELYKLKHNGKKIKELYECQKKSRSKEHEFTEYVHKVVSKQPKDDKKPKKENESQKKAPPQNKKGDSQKPPQQNNKPNKQTSRGGFHSRGRGDHHQGSSRNRSPPPSYQDVSDFPHSTQSYRPQGAAAHPPGPYNYGPYSPSPGPYTPPPYGHNPFTHTRDPVEPKKEAGTYEVKITLNKDSARDLPTREAYPQYPPPHYPPGPTHPPYYGYPSSHYPPGSYPPGHYPPPPSGYPYPYAPGYPQHYSGPAQRGQHQGTSQQRERRNDGGNRRGRGAFRGGQGAHKFKAGNRRKKNENAVADSDEDSDSSVASSKK